MPVSKRSGQRTDAQQDADIVRKGLRRKKKTAGANLDVSPNSRVGKHDWETAREIFLTAQPAINLKQLALRTGIPYQVMRNKAARERWNASRVQEQMTLLKEKRQRFLMDMGAEAISFDQTAVDVSKVGMGIVAQRLIEVSRFMQAADGVKEAVIHKLKEGIPLEKGDLYGIVNYRELLGLAQSAQLFQQIGRTALGTEVTDAAFLQGNDVDPDEERVVSIGAELAKDDPNRLAAFIEVMERMGMLSGEVEESEEVEEPEDGTSVIEGTFTEQPAIEGPKDV